MEVESSLVGLIIGRQGENLRRVEADSQTRIQFVPAADQSDPFRICKITGPRARRNEARAAINKIIEDSGVNGGGRGGPDRSRDTRGSGGGFNSSASGELPALKEGEECIQIMVPDRTVGLIIGRGGETIRDLQERSACHINIVGENKSVNGLRPVNLIGIPSAASMAKNLIMEIVDSDSRNGGPAAGGGGRGGDGGHRPPRNDMRDGGGEKDSMYVPSEAVGMIIGKGGETIREMQSTTGCKINVSQSSGPGETEREIGLVGSRDAINRAKQAIDEKVEAVVS
jgi:far upstream element-binding protein